MTVTDPTGPIAKPDSGASGVAVPPGEAGRRGPAGDGVLARVRAQLPEFTGALQRVAERVLADPAAAARATIVELAERSGTSPATVTRFCRAVGFDGYAELRLGIAGETGRAARAAGWSVDIGREIQPGDSLERVLGQLTAADARAVQETVAVLNLDQVAAAADAIAAATRTDIYGVGGSGLVGAELQLSLHRIGVPGWAWTDVHSGLASAAVLAPGDVAIGISHSGQTREVIEMLAEAGSRGATTVAVTSLPRSPLAELADLLLATAVTRPEAGRYAGHEAGGETGRCNGGAETRDGARQARAGRAAAGFLGGDRDRTGPPVPGQASAFRPDALSARHPQLVVLDLLYIAVAQRTHDRAHAAFQRTARAVDGHRSAPEQRQQ